MVGWQLLGCMGSKHTSRWPIIVSTLDWNQLTLILTIERWERLSFGVIINIYLPSTQGTKSISVTYRRICWRGIHSKVMRMNVMLKPYTCTNNERVLIVHSMPMIKEEWKNPLSVSFCCFGVNENIIYRKTVCTLDLNIKYGGIHFMWLFIQTDRNVERI